MVDTQYLEDKIRESGKSKSHLSKKLGCDRSSLYKKIHNSTEFKLTEVTVLCNELGISSLQEKERIFYAKDVTKRGDK